MENKQFNNLEEKNAYHISIMNDEMGDMRDKQETIRIDMAGVKTDLAWLKRFFWIVAASSVGALLANVLQFLK